LKRLSKLPLVATVLPMLQIGSVPALIAFKLGLSDTVLILSSTKSKPMSQLRSADCRRSLNWSLKKGIC